MTLTSPESSSRTNIFGLKTKSNASTESLALPCNSRTSESSRPKDKTLSFLRARRGLFRSNRTKYVTINTKSVSGVQTKADDPSEKKAKTIEERVLKLREGCGLGTTLTESCNFGNKDRQEYLSDVKKRSRYVDSIVRGMKEWK